LRAPPNTSAAHRDYQTLTKDMSSDILNILLAAIGVLLSVIGFLLTFLLLRVTKKQDNHDSDLTSQGQLLAKLSENIISINDRQDSFDALVHEIGRDLKEILISRSRRKS
jgi:flagellar basal body-associated protein FliL